MAENVHLLLLFVDIYSKKYLRLSETLTILRVVITMYRLVLEFKFNMYNTQR